MQAAQFRDAMQEIEALGAVVCGVSVDATGRLAHFAQRYRLPFAFLSDRGGSIAARYGSLLNLGLVKMARRNTFLIDPHGRVAKVYQAANPSGNAGEVVEDLRKLKVRHEPAL